MKGSDHLRIYQQLGKCLASIEAEMRHIRVWDISPPDNTECTLPFGQDSMSFEQWLRYVFIPNARKIVQSRGQLPSNSSVSVQSIREFGDDNRFKTLQKLLSEFDKIVREHANTGKFLEKE